MQFPTSAARPSNSRSGLGGTHRPSLGNHPNGVANGGGGSGTSGNGGRRRENLIETAMRILPMFMDLFLRVLGPVLVLFAWGLFAAITYIYFEHLLPMRELSPWDFPGNLYTGIGVWILVNLYYNHASAVFTSPGHPTEEAPANIEQLMAEEAPLLKRGEVFARYCRNCIKPKPERAHHCHICNRCVLKMDHHCPWIGNCVGHYNYKFFYLFLVYLWIGCIYVVAMSIPAMLLDPSPTRRKHESSVFFGVVLAGSASFALAIMGVLHTYLILTNQSTIELYTNRRLKMTAQRRGEVWFNRYDIGMRKNWQQVFGVGRYWWSWLLPGKPDIGDGTRFATAATPHAAPMDVVRAV